MSRHSRVTTDERGVMLHVEPSFTDVLGWPPEQVTGRRLGELTHPDDLKHGLRSWVQLLQQQDNRAAAVRLRCRHLDGHWVWMEVAYRHHPGNREEVLVDLVDVQREVELLALLAARDQLLARLGELSAVGAFLGDLTGRMLYASQRLEEMTKVTSAASLAEQLSMVSESDRPRLTTAIQRAAGGEKALIQVSTEFGRWRISLWPILSDTGEVRAMGGTVEDEKGEGSTSGLEYDPLTGALAREATIATFVELVQSGSPAGPRSIPAETRRREDTVGTACIVLRLGALEPFTAQHGPEARDELLSLVALRVRDSVRSSDLLGRTCDDELTVLCVRVPGPTSALSIAQAVMSQVNQPMTLSSGLALTIRPGIGVGWTSGAGSRAEQILAKAQTAAVESATSSSPEPVLATPPREPRVPLDALPFSGPAVPGGTPPGGPTPGS